MDKKPAFEIIGQSDSPQCIKIFADGHVEGIKPVL